MPGAEAELADARAEAAEAAEGKALADPGLADERLALALTLEPTLVPPSPPQLNVKKQTLNRVTVRRLTIERMLLRSGKAVNQSQNALETKPLPELSSLRAAPFD